MSLIFFLLIFLGVRFFIIKFILNELKFLNLFFFNWVLGSCCVCFLIYFCVLYKNIDYLFVLDMIGFVYTILFIIFDLM